MASIAWPAILRPTDFGFWLENVDRSGGVGLAGGEQIVASPGARWRAAGRFPIRSNEEVLALRALVTQLDGRVNDILLPNFDGQRLSWPIQTHGGDSTGVVLHPGVTRNKALDGTAYADAEIPAVSEINATVNTNAALRATTLLINMTQGGALLAGQQFGIGTTNRLYQIGTIVLVAGAVTTVTFRPPLRAAATATTAVKFTRPVCLMKLADPSQLPKRLDLLRTTDLDLEFVESF